MKQLWVVVVAVLSVCLPGFGLDLDLDVPWDKAKCVYSEGSNLQVSASGDKGMIILTIKNFRSVVENSDRHELKFKVDHATVGDLELVDGSTQWNLVHKRTEDAFCDVHATLQTEESPEFTFAVSNCKDLAKKGVKGSAADFKTPEDKPLKCATIVE